MGVIRARVGFRLIVTLSGVSWTLERTASWAKKSQNHNLEPQQKLCLRPNRVTGMLQRG